jgi:hypothetical protein
MNAVSVPSVNPHGRKIFLLVQACQLFENINDECYIVRYHSARDMPHMNPFVGWHRHASSFLFSIWPAAVMNDKPHLIVNRRNL